MALMSLIRISLASSWTSFLIWTWSGPIVVVHRWTVIVVLAPFLLLILPMVRICGSLLEFLACRAPWVRFGLITVHIDLVELKLLTGRLWLIGLSLLVIAFVLVIVFIVFFFQIRLCLWSWTLSDLLRLLVLLFCWTRMNRAFLVLVQNLYWVRNSVRLLSWLDLTVVVWHLLLLRLLCFFELLVIGIHFKSLDSSSSVTQ